MYKYIMLPALLLITGNVTAQNKRGGSIFEERQQYLIENLSFYYVPNPNNKTGKVYKLDNQAIAYGKREGPFWEDSTLAPLSQLVAKLICKPLGVMNAKGDEFVQEYAVTLLKILNKPVQVWFYNDYTCEAGLPEGETIFRLLETKPKPYLIPLAYADFHTLCKTRSKSEFSEIFGGELPHPWIDLYWDTAREKVRKAVLKDEGGFVKVDIYHEWLHLINGALNIK